jgi:hypothetical protein
MSNYPLLTNYGVQTGPLLYYDAPLRGAIVGVPPREAKT